MIAISSLLTHGIPLDLLTVQARSGYVKIQSINKAGRYQSHESLLKISGSV